MKEERSFERGEHIESHSLITHHFVAESWSLVDIAGCGCQGNPLEYLLVTHRYPLQPLVVNSMASKSPRVHPDTLHHQWLFRLSWRPIAEFHVHSMGCGHHITANLFLCGLPFRDSVN